MAQDVLITTMDDIPGWEIQEVLGEVFGVTVRSRHVGSDIGASLKSLVGGEVKGFTKMLVEGRREGLARLTDETRERGGNAVVAMRFDTSSIGDSTEICAYGTAVRARKV